jgi:hypothetical protein
MDLDKIKTLNPSDTLFWTYYSKRWIQINCFETFIVYYNTTMHIIPQCNIMTHYSTHTYNKLSCACKIKYVTTKHNKLKKILFHKVSSSVTFRNFLICQNISNVCLISKLLLLVTRMFKRIISWISYSKAMEVSKFRNGLICIHMWRWMALYTQHAIATEREYEPMHTV